MPKRKIGIVCCSNGHRREWQEQNHQLSDVLVQMGFDTVFSECIYAVNGSFSGTAKERADALMTFYRDDSVDMICDISGGDIANEILPHLDFEEIERRPKPFFGYSDLTTILNAIYTKTGNHGVLYQLKNLVYTDSAMQQKTFSDTYSFGKDGLYQFPYTFLQGNHMEGIVVGGNVRCFLKLAGTEYFPDMNGKLLLLEALGGEIEQVTTYFSQLKQMGVFERINGVILGTFTRMEENQLSPTVYELLSRVTSPDLPVIKTKYIGHGTDSRAVVIGKHRIFA